MLTSNFLYWELFLLFNYRIVYIMNLFWWKFHKRKLCTCKFNKNLPCVKFYWLWAKSSQIPIFLLNFSYHRFKLTNLIRLLQQQIIFHARVFTNNLRPFKMPKCKKINIHEKMLQIDYREVKCVHSTLWQYRLAWEIFHRSYSLYSYSVIIIASNNNKHANIIWYFTLQRNVLIHVIPHVYTHKHILLTLLFKRPQCPCWQG